MSLMEEGQLMDAFFENTNLKFQGDIETQGL